MANGKGYAYEHRLVAEQALGRELVSADIVHHQNGMKDDNRPENLVVMSQSEHIELHKPNRWATTERAV
ncbi:hypothetical protein LCGC14_1126150 [marine sediment metagenome]|uniref:HNH nuclease domain-containing protein n=1 Tax=marine sediment metagenome TaxID=412755 RepID=A0A0F9M2J1_9ZZZZ